MPFASLRLRRSFAPAGFAVWLAALVVMSLATLAPAAAQGEAQLRPLVDALGKGGFDDVEKAIGALAATGDSAVAPVLDALAAGDLYARESDGRVFIAKRLRAGQMELTDPLSDAVAGEAATGTLDKVRVNNRIRRAVSAALGGLTLMSKDAQRRRAAAAEIFSTGDAEAIPLLDEAIEKEQVPAIQTLMREARAAAVLRSDRGEGDKLAAVQVLAERGGRDVLPLLAGVAGEGGTAAAVAASAIGTINTELVAWDAGQNIWYGLSLGSVLLLAALGLAITFGVMGVINMAHGEMVMIGAYTTFVVQDLIRTSAPELFDLSLVIALPLAFLIAGAIGVAIERGIIRFLYGRPLETLLATWGLSLILQQGVRTLFGPSNREVGNPSWMSGAFDLGEMTITYNRLAIIIFALAVFAALILTLRYTAFGLQMRAVTQNRRMAGAVGIRTPYVDALTFGLGSGIAGIAGVALSQISNVSPNLGQTYIIDSFMVVVFGGVGNLWGTLVGAFTLGVANKFLEPYAGAVLAKILVLIVIILFIQKRPRGLFALKGRSVEA